MLLVFPLFIALACLLILETPVQAAAATKAKPDCVVLLHGLGRTPWSLKRLEWHLQSQGYQVLNLGYPSTRRSIEELADVHLHRALQERLPCSAGRVHFVTHSMGGIVLRQYLSNHTLTNLGRVLMLAPPNQGSEVIDQLRQSSLARCLLGPGAMQLGTGADDFPRRLGAVRFECGVVACDRSLNPWLSRWFSGPNDGKVAVERTKVAGMNDFILLHATHTWMMWRDDTLRQTVSFLRNGRFAQPTSDIPDRRTATPNPR